MCTKRSIIKNRLLLSGALLLCCCASSFAEMRIWRDKSGNTYAGEYVRVIFGGVAIRTPDKTQVNIPLEDLSVEDTKYLQKLILPKITIDVRSKKREKERNPDNEANGANQFFSEWIVATLNVTVRKQGKMPYDGALPMEVYFFADELLTDDIRLVSKQTASVVFNEENRGVFTFTAEAEIQRYRCYTGDERGAQYSGYLVVVYDPQGNRMDYKTNLSWIKEDKIETIRKYRGFTFMDKEARKRPVPRPRNVFY